MPLKLTLKPDEKVLIGTAVVVNAGHKAELVVLNRVPVLREKDIIAERDADTPAKMIYVVILNMYLNPEGQGDLHKVYFPLLQQLIHMDMDQKGLDLMVSMSRKILEGDHYKALKLCKKLIDYEKEALIHEQ